MARYDFGGTLADFVVTSRRLGGLDVLGLSAATLTFWSAQSGGTQYTDLQLNGSATSSIAVASDGQVPTFQGPDSATVMWADGGSGRVRIVAQGVPGPAGPVGPGAINSVDAAKTASATLTASHHAPVDATSGAQTMTLPTGAAVGTLVSVEKTDASTNPVNVTGTLRGVASSTIPLASQYEVRTFISEGSGSWRPVSDHRTAASLSATYVPTIVAAAPVGVAATDHAAITSAIARASAIATSAVPVEVELRDGNYKLTGTVTLPQYVHLKGRGPKRTTLTLSGDSAAVSAAGGSLAAAVTLGADALAGSRAITLSTAITGLVAGDWLLVGNDTIYDVNSGRKYGEAVQVDTVAGTAITLRTGLYRTYTTATNAGAQRYTLTAGPKIGGFKVVNPVAQTGQAPAVYLSKTLGARLYDLDAADLGTWAYHLDHCMSFVAEHLSGNDFADDDATGHFGYGILINGASYGGVIDSPRFARVRHAFTTGGQDNGRGGPANIEVHNGWARNTSKASWDTHPGAIDIRFKNCDAIESAGGSSFGYGYQVRSPRTTILNCNTLGGPAFLFTISDCSGLVFEGGVQQRLTGSYAAQLDGDITDAKIVTTLEAANSGVLLTATSTGDRPLIQLRARGAAAGGSTAVRVDGTHQYVQVAGGYFDNFPIPVTVAGASCFRTTVVRNEAIRCTGRLVSDSGASTYQRDNRILDQNSVEGVTLATNGVVTFDTSKGMGYHRATLQANATGITINRRSGVDKPGDGEELIIEFLQDATGGRTYAWGGFPLTFAGGAAPANVTTPNARQTVGFRYVVATGGFHEVWRANY